MASPIADISRYLRGRLDAIEQHDIDQPFSSTWTALGVSLLLTEAGQALLMGGILSSKDTVLKIVAVEYSAAGAVVVSMSLAVVLWLYLLGRRKMKLLLIYATIWLCLMIIAFTTYNISLAPLETFKNFERNRIWIGVSGGIAHMPWMIVVTCHVVWASRAQVAREGRNDIEEPGVDRRSRGHVWEGRPQNPSGGDRNFGRGLWQSYNPGEEDGGECGGLWRAPGQYTGTNNQPMGARFTQLPSATANKDNRKAPEIWKQTADALSSRRSDLPVFETYDRTCSMPLDRGRRRNKQAILQEQRRDSVLGFSSQDLEMLPRSTEHDKSITTLHRQSSTNNGEQERTGLTRITTSSTEAMADELGDTQQPKSTSVVVGESGSTRKTEDVQDFGIEANNGLRPENTNLRKRNHRGRAEQET